MVGQKEDRGAARYGTDRGEAHEGEGVKLNRLSEWPAQWDSYIIAR